MNWPILILSYNHWQMTEKCVVSARKICPSSSLYLVHNGSDTNQINHLKNTFNHDTNLFHVIIVKNLGYSGGMNFGLDYIFKQHQQVIVLTNDTELRQVPDYFDFSGVIAPLILNHRTGKIDSFGGFFIPRKAHLYHNKLMSSIFLDQTHQLTYVPGTAFVLSRDVFVKVGGFSLDLGTYWEDVEWSQKVKDAGFKLILNSNFKLSHKIGRTCHKDKFYTSFLFQRNRCLISMKYTRTFLMKVSLFMLLAYQWISRLLKLFFSGSWDSLNYHVQVVVSLLRFQK